MEKVLILGSTGHLGKVLLNEFLKNNFQINVLVRNKNKLNVKDKNLKIFEGQITIKNDLSVALENVDVVISALGHGFRTKFPIQEEALKALLPLMGGKNIKRLITISGAGLKTKDDPNTLTLELSSKLFEIVDPDRMADAKTQQDLIEKSNLDWTVVRTPVHRDGEIKKIKHIGYSQPKPWNRISRKTISSFIIDLIKNDEWIRKSPIIY